MKYKVLRSEYKMPTYFGKLTERVERQNRYYKNATQIFCNNEELTEEEYCNLLSKINSGDIEARKILANKSLGIVLKGVAFNFAKYDIEDVISLEDGISYCFHELFEAIMSFENFPNKYSEYIRGFVNMRMHRFLEYLYNETKIREEYIENMPIKDLISILDELENEETASDRIIKNEFNIIFNNVTKDFTTDRCLSILKHFYGIDCDQLTSQELAQKYNITTSGVFANISHLISRMRKSSVMIELKKYNDLLN